MPIALDTETTLFSNSEPVPRLVSVAMASPAGVSLWPAHRVDWSAVEAALAEGVIMANAPFDVTVLLRARPELLPAVLDAYEGDRVYDVITRDKMLDAAEGVREPGRRYNLGALAERRAGLQVDKSDPWRKRYAELLGLELEAWPDEARRYALHDAVATYAVWAAQERDAGDVFRNAGLQARGHLCLYLQTLRGLRTDPAAVAELDARLASQIVECERQLVAAGLARVGGTRKAPRIVRDTKAAMALVREYAESTGAEVIETKRGASLAEEQLEELDLPAGHPLEAYQRLGSRKSLRKKAAVFTRPLVRTRYDEFKVTGRTGSSSPQGKKDLAKVPPDDWVGTNLQNLPRGEDPAKVPYAVYGFRECLVPRHGMRFLVNDFSAAELVTLAQVCLDWFGHSVLAEIMRDPTRDAHREMAASIIGATVDRVTKDDRQLAKAANFGFPGGLGPTRFVAFAKNSYGVTLTESRARSVKEIWRETLPEMRDYHERIGLGCVDIDGTYHVVVPRSGLVRGGCSFNEACNFPFQSLAATAAKQAMWDLWRAQLDHRSALYGSHQVLFVHDEIVLETPEDRADEALAEQSRIMIAAFAKWCPDVPVRTEGHVLERYTKG